MRIERHDVNRTAGLLPWPVAADKMHYWPPERLARMTPKYKDGVIVSYTHTVQEEIEWHLKEHGRWFGRMDIVRINEDVPCTCSCGNKHTTKKQYVVYPGRDGTLRGDVHKLSAADREWALQESKKCWEVELLRRVIK